MASGNFNYQSDALKNGRRGINRCMIRHQSLKGFQNNVSHDRLCQVQLAMNKINADKHLVKLNFSYRKCILKIFVRPNFQFQVCWVCKKRLKLNVSYIVRMNRCAT